MLCAQGNRVVASDNTARCQCRYLQIPPDRHRFHYVKVTVRVPEYLDSTLAAFLWPMVLSALLCGGVVE